MLTKYIKELVDLVGVSSREEEVIRYIFPKFKEYSEDVHVDKLGNIILKIPSKKENVKKLMIFLIIRLLIILLLKIMQKSYWKITWLIINR